MKIYIKADKDSERFKIRWEINRDISIVIDGKRQTLETYTWKYDRLNTFKISPDYDGNQLSYYVLVFNRVHRDPLIGKFRSVEEAMEFVGSEWYNYIYEP